MKKKKEKPLFRNDFLNEDFELTENREDGLRQAVCEMSERTCYKLVTPSNFMIYSLLKPRDDKKDAFHVAILDPDFSDMHILTPKNVAECYFRPENKTLGYVKIADLRKCGMTEEQIDEIEKNGYFLQYRTEKSTMTLIPSKAFLSTLCRQLGIGKLNEGIDSIRNIYLASRMRDGEPFTLVYRKSQSGYSKAFGCFSKKFPHHSQIIIFDFKDQLSAFGLVSVRHWAINHFLTSVDFAFHDIGVRVGKLKLTPGVRLSLSDVGDSSYILQNTLYTNGGVVLFDELVSRKHTGTLEVEDMMRQYRENQYPKLKKAIALLEELDQIPVKDKRTAILLLFQKIQIASAFGKSNFKEFKKQYLPKEENIPCTALDVVLFILKIPGIVRPSYKAFATERVALAVGKVLTLDIRRILS